MAGYGAEEDLENGTCGGQSKVSIQLSNTNLNERFIAFGVARLAHENSGYWMW